MLGFIIHLDIGGIGLHSAIIKFVAEYKAEKNCSQGEAVKAVAKANPEAHEKYVADLKAK